MDLEQPGTEATGQGTHYAEEAGVARGEDAHPPGLGGHCVEDGGHVALDGGGAGPPAHHGPRGPELAVAPDHEVGAGQGPLGGRPQRARPPGQAHHGDRARHGRPSPGHRSRP